MTINLGIIGLSEGNGHPYSWAAICNGFNADKMKDCPFPTISQYLDQQDWPEARLPDVQVTHIWTQDRLRSEHIAEASLIPHVVSKMPDMIGEVDGVLLARDDAGRHEEMARPFLEAGIPIFIDKPFSLSTDSAQIMLGAQKFDSQIFTCSSLRYAKELLLSSEDKRELGEPLWVEASVMKYWDTYAIHLLEPIILNKPDRGDLIDVHLVHKSGIKQVLVEWKNFTAYLKVTGSIPSPLAMQYFGPYSTITKIFYDSFSCFKQSISDFLVQIRTQRNLIPREETMELIKILEWGRK